MKKRNLVIGLLITLAVAVSGFTFAYWAGNIDISNNTASANVTIGEGGTTKVTAVAGTSSQADLVPTAHVVNAGDDRTVLSFNVKWEEVSASASGTGTLVVNADTYTMTGLTKAQIDAMFSITVTGNGDDISVGSAGTPVTVTVTFHTEPATKALYDLVTASDLVITITFTVTPA